MLMTWMRNGTTWWLSSTRTFKTSKIMNIPPTSYNFIVVRFNIYFYGFIMCECLNVTVAFSVLFLTNKFLNHRFLLYGLKVWRYYSLPEEEHRFEINPMCDTFPRIATCDYYRWGPGGRQENVNAICVLALNMINDKVFLIFWFWLLILLITGCSRIFFRLFQVR